MKVLIAGSSGLVGSALIESLGTSGDEAIRLLRRNTAEGSPSWDPEKGVIDLANVRDITAVVNLAGDDISGGRWNDRKKSRILNSRVRGTRLLSEFFTRSNQKPRVILSASAVGVYGDRREELVDEASEPGNGFLAHVSKRWEGATAAAVDAGIRVVKLRFGMVRPPAGAQAQAADRLGPARHPPALPLAARA